MAQVSSRTSLTSSPASPPTPSLISTPRSGHHPSTDTEFTTTSSSPKPYLPLRKASSEALRNGHVNPRRTPQRRHQDVPKVIPTKDQAIHGLDENAGTILPSSVYVPPSKQHPSPQFTIQTPSPPLRGRSRSFSENRTSKQAVRNTILRAATSIPDYKAIKEAYKQTAANYPPSPQTPEVSRVVSTGQSLHSTRKSTFWKDGGADSLRASIRSAMTNESSALEWSETERSSVWTEASTASEFVPNNWPLIKEERCLLKML